MTTSALNTSQYVFAKEVRAGTYNSAPLFVLFYLYFVFIYFCFIFA
jgi:hypothetical protein